MLIKLRTDNRMIKRIFYGFIIGLVCFAIVGFFILPPIIKSVLVKNMSEKLHRTVSISKVAFNPFTLTADFEGLHISERGGQGDFVSCERLHLNLEAVSLVKRGMIIKEVRIVKPAINIVRDSETHYNFSDLLAPDKTKAPSGSGQFRFSLNNIEIDNGRIDFHDGPKQTEHKVREINLKIPFLSNLPYYLDSYVKPSFEAKVNDRPVSLGGESKPFKDSHETTININITDLDIPYYLAYLPVNPGFRIPSALLTTRLVLSFLQSSGKRPLLTLSGDVDLTRVRITDSAGDLLTALPAVRMSIQSAEVFSRAVHLKRLGFESPELNLVRKKGGSLNIDVLRPKKTAASKQTKPTDAPSTTLDIDEVRVAGGKMQFADVSTPVGFRTVIDPIDVSLDHFSTTKDKKTAVSFSAKTGFGEEVKIAGELSVEPLTANGLAEGLHIPLKKYAPYYADRLLFSIEDAVLDLSVRYSFAIKERTADPLVKLSDVAASLRNLKLRRNDEKEYFLKIPELTVSGGSIDPGQKEIVLGRLSTRSGVVVAQQSADGTISLMNLLASQPAPSVSTQGTVKGRTAEKDWQYTVQNMRIENYGLLYSDYIPSTPVELKADRIMLNANRISNRKGSTGNATFSMLIGKKGSFSGDGSFGINPFSSKMKVSLRNMELSPVQMYVTDRTNVIIADGAVSAAGTVSVSKSAEGPMKTGYQGEVSFSGFRAVDTVNTEELISWNNLSITGIDAGYNPLRWHIREVALTDFYSRLIINPNGTLNLQEVMKKQPEEAKTPSQQQAAAAPPAATSQAVTPTAEIDVITLQGGTVQFSDFYIKPNYTARLMEIGGRISGLSSEENVMGDIDLRGKVDNYAPLAITGKINPLRSDLFVDLKAVVKDVDLSPVTPYSGRYAGYTIQKGKLSLDLTYHILKKKLDAQNKMFIDQLTFGDQVESPDATKLPVKLAVALLKNRKGEINLDLPVSGYIDDPKFSVGRIIIKILLNLLVKAATSPFALLGAIFGGGEELSFIDYDAGSTAISGPAAKKLDTLIKALHERPSLKLEIEGHVDLDKDREGLIRASFMRKLKAQKLKAMVRKGEAAPPVDTLTIDPAEYALYLKAAYKEEKFPKPRNFIGIAKDLPVQEMEKLMLAHVEITENDLRQLARQRALQVEEYLLKSKQVERERIFFIEPKALQPEKKEKMKDSRVDFRLK